MLAGGRVEPGGRVLQSALANATGRMAASKTHGISEIALRDGVTQRLFHAVTPALADVGDRIVVSTVEFADPSAMARGDDAFSFLGPAGVEAAGPFDAALRQANIRVGNRADGRLGR